MEQYILNILSQLKKPDPNSHKGQNGKLMIIGGSELFHAASRWSLDIASKFVDMVFYSSVPSNNELIKEAKQNFWNGIVIERSNIEEYIEEADVVLIGPGMERGSENRKTGKQESSQQLSSFPVSQLSELDWNSTEQVTNYLLAKYPHKKWVIDAGALQMMDPSLLNENCIVTPHYQELLTLCKKLPKKSFFFEDFMNDIEEESDVFMPVNIGSVIGMSRELNKAVLLIKGKIDYVGNTENVLTVSGGNAGMTKGGTGDVLAGLVAALYCTNDAMTSAVVGSYINKKAGESLFKKVGYFFNASDLVEEIPRVMVQAPDLSS